MRILPALHRYAFYVSVAGVLAWTILIASINRYPGSPDSYMNLIIARSLADGDGFQSNVVSQYCTPEDLDEHIDTIRQPAVPYLVAPLFHWFGASLAIPIVLNGLTIVASCFVIRWAIRTWGGTWTADLAATLFLLAGNYEIVSLWNNNLLVLVVSLMLLTAARITKNEAPQSPIARFGSVRDFLGQRLRLDGVLGLLTAAGFYLKPSFILTAIPLCGCALLFGMRRMTIFGRLGSLASCVLISVMFTSPYWGWNLAHHSDPLFHPIKSGRLAITFKLVPGDEYGLRTIRFGEAVTYPQVFDQLGVDEAARRQFRHVQDSFKGLWKLSWPVFVVGIAALALLARRQRVRTLILLCCFISPLFECVYFHFEQRYLWSAFPAMLMLMHPAFQSWATNSLRAIRNGRVAWWLVGNSPPQLATVLSVAGVVVMATAAPKCVRQWRTAHAVAGHHQTPAWVETILSQTPTSARVMSEESHEVAWYTRRAAMRVPMGTVKQQLGVLDRYKPTHYLQFDAAEWTLPTEHLALIAESDGWRLFRIRRELPAFEQPSRAREVKRIALGAR